MLLYAGILTFWLLVKAPTASGTRFPSQCMTSALSTVPADSGAYQSAFFPRKRADAMIFVGTTSPVTLLRSYCIPALSFSLGFELCDLLMTSFRDLVLTSV